MNVHEEAQANNALAFQSATDAGNTAVKNAAFVSGGSVVVGLGLVGSVYDPQNPALALGLMTAVAIFTLGVIFAGAATGFRYLGQITLYHGRARREHTVLRHPYIFHTAESRAMFKTGRRWDRLAVASIVISYFCIIGGVGVALCISRQLMISTAAI